MPPKPPEPPIAHIHGARFPQDPIEIIGNKPGLERLINLLIDAIGTSGSKDTIYSSDGNHSEVRATCLQGKRRPEEWRQSGSPLWDVDDPRIARIVELTEENRRLRRLITTLRSLTKTMTQADPLGPHRADDGGAAAQG